MLSSITPLGERGRNNSWAHTVGFYVVGSVLGGAVMGTVFGALGALIAAFVTIPLTVQLGVLAIAAALGALFDTDRFRRKMPTIHRQVNEDWLDTYRSWVYGGGFGFQLGLGLVTIVTTASVYLMFLLIVLAGSWQFGLLIGTVFGLARAVPIFAMREVKSPDRLNSLFRRLSAAEPRARWSLIGTQVAVCLVAAAGVLLSST